MARGHAKGASVSKTMGRSKTHGTRGGAKEHIPHAASKKLHGKKMHGGRGTRVGHGGGKYKTRSNAQRGFRK